MFLSVASYFCILKEGNDTNDCFPSFEVRIILNVWDFIIDFESLEFWDEVKYWFSMILGSWQYYKSGIESETTFISFYISSLLINFSSMALYFLMEHWSCDPISTSPPSASYKFFILLEYYWFSYFSVGCLGV